MRNTLKIIEDGRTLIRKRPKLDMYVQETQMLGNRIRESQHTADALWNNLHNAYLLGLMTGYRAAKREKAKKKA